MDNYHSGLKMSKKFNDNILKALEASHEAVKICKQAMIDANDESVRWGLPFKSTNRYTNC